MKDFMKKIGVRYAVISIVFFAISIFSFAASAQEDMDMGNAIGEMRLEFSEKGIKVLDAEGALTDEEFQSRVREGKIKVKQIIPTTIVISNPCGWINLGGAWYYLCIP